MAVSGATCMYTNHIHIRIYMHPPIHPSTHNTHHTHARLHAETGEGWRRAGDTLPARGDCLGCRPSRAPCVWEEREEAQNFRRTHKSHHASMDIDTNECTRGYAQGTHTYTSCIRERSCSGLAAHCTCAHTAIYGFFLFFPTTINLFTRTSRHTHTPWQGVAAPSFQYAPAHQRGCAPRSRPPGHPSLFARS